VSAPKGLDPEILTVFEIVQHCGEILARLPLATVRGYLLTARPGPDDPQDAWYRRAIALVLAAEAFELANAEISAAEARHAAPPPPMGADIYPDDALPSS
jgi:hypothetical protein